MPLKALPLILKLKKAFAAGTPASTKLMSSPGLLNTKSKVAAFNARNPTSAVTVDLGSIPGNKILVDNTSGLFQPGGPATVLLDKAQFMRHIPAKEAGAARQAAGKLGGGFATGVGFAAPSAIKTIGGLGQAAVGTAGQALQNMPSVGISDAQMRQFGATPGMALGGAAGQGVQAAGQVVGDTTREVAHALRLHQLQKKIAGMSPEMMHGQSAIINATKLPQ